MLNMLAAVAENSFESRQQAIESFNTMGNIVFEQAETIEMQDITRGHVWVTFIWFTKVERKEESKELVFEYIGTPPDLDPTDPTWKDRWEDNGGYASVGSQEGSGATEEEK